MPTDKSKLERPRNNEENREILANVLVNDMSVRDVRRKVKEVLIKAYKASDVNFLKDYWEYYDETYGHCPFGLNDDSS